MKKLLITSAITLGLAIPAQAQEQKYVNFVCNNVGSAAQVAYDTANGDDMIYGISALPSGCEWVYGNRLGQIGETVQVIGLPDGRYARVSVVVTDDYEGFSAGLIELLS